MKWLIKHYANRKHYDASTISANSYDHPAYPLSLIEAATHGRLRVVKWLYENIEECQMKDNLIWAANCAKGMQKADRTVKWLNNLINA
jgi:hypothetical protein